jgi:hypothetical protein
MPFWSRFFGSASPADPAPAAAEAHKGFRITPTPIREGGQFRVSAMIEKDGRTHRLIRADTTGSEDEARAISVAKAKQMIDEQGEGLFG